MKRLMMCLVVLFGDKGYAAEWSITADTRSLILMPSQSVQLQLDSNLEWGSFEDIRLSEGDNGQWLLHAPEQPGISVVTLKSDNGSNAHELNVMVMAPLEAASTQQINGYQIGQYPLERYKGLNSYQPPAGLVPVAEADLDKYLSAHVQIKDIICKQVSGYPKYVYVTRQGLEMLEALLVFVRANGISAPRFSFISGYRTPYYNRSIGNGTYSRHIYGDAFDIYVDADGDGRMDDLNNDGSLDIDDVTVLYDLFGRFLKETDYVGGLGRYRPTSVHGGFVHIDNRGFSARW